MTGIQKIIKLGAIGLAIFIIVNIVSALFLFLSFFTNVNFIKSDSNSYNTNFSETYQNINNLELDLITSNVKLKKGTTWKVEATKVDKNFKVIKENNTLKIKEKNNWFAKILNRSKEIGEIIIYVPEGIMNDLDIDGGVGKFEIEQIKATELDIDSGVGYIKIKDSKFSKTKIDGGVGQIIITSSILNDLDIDGGVGEIDIEAYITGNSKIECGIGNIKLDLLGKEKDYQIYAEKGLGSIKINGETYSDKKTNELGINHIKLIGGAGEIKVNYNENINWKQNNY